MKKKLFVIYWEKSNLERGFVSYSNPATAYYLRDEYHPVSLWGASKYFSFKDAKRIKDWYDRRCGFGEFTVMELA